MRHLDRVVASVIIRGNESRVDVNGRSAGVEVSGQWSEEKSPKTYLSKIKNQKAHTPVFARQHDLVEVAPFRWLLAFSKAHNRLKGGSR